MNRTPFMYCNEMLKFSNTASVVNTMKMGKPSDPSIKYNKKILTQKIEKNKFVFPTYGWTGLDSLILSQFCIVTNDSRCMYMLRM